MLNDGRRVDQVAPEGTEFIGLTIMAVTTIAPIVMGEIARRGAEKQQAALQTEQMAAQEEAEKARIAVEIRRVQGTERKSLAMMFLSAAAFLTVVAVAT